MSRQPSGKSSSKESTLIRNKGKGKAHKKDRSVEKQGRLESKGGYGSVEGFEGWALLLNELGAGASVASGDEQSGRYDDAVQAESPQAPDDFAGVPEQYGAAYGYNASISSPPPSMTAFNTYNASLTNPPETTLLLCAERVDIGDGSPKIQTELQSPAPHKYHERYRKEFEKEDFRVQGSREFRRGRLVKLFWFEPKPPQISLEGPDTDTDIDDSLKFQLPSGKIRRFVIIQTLHGYSTGIPINTYGFQGTLKAGCRPEEHALIYTPPRPELRPGENLQNPPIQVTLSTGEQLFEDSRVNYAKRCKIEHSLAVKFIGEIAASSSDDFWHTFNRISASLPHAKVHSGQPQKASSYGAGLSAEGPTASPPDCTPLTQNSQTGGSSIPWYDRCGSRGDVQYPAQTKPINSDAYGRQIEAKNPSPQPYRSYDGQPSSSYNILPYRNAYSGQNAEGDRLQSDRGNTSRQTAQSRPNGRSSRQRGYAEDRPRGADYSIGISNTNFHTLSPPKKASVRRQEAGVGSSTVGQSPPPVAPHSSTNTRRLNLLSLDGGGVRGLSSLLILKDIMARVNKIRRTQKLDDVKPYQIFDLIGGTSTGGIIAIMLGRLHMDVDECITVYTKLFSLIFGKPGSIVSWKLQIQGRYNASTLERKVKELLTDMGKSEHTAFMERDPSCKVAVCAISKETGEPRLIRSYASPYPLDDDLKPAIWQAARATSAATTFFDPIVINTMSFSDGGMGANNPVNHIWNEAHLTCKDEGTNLLDNLNCFISIGTGDPGLQPLKDKKKKELFETFQAIVTETRETARAFRKSHPYLQQKYYRFNVDHGLGEIGLDEYKKEPDMRAATQTYMDDHSGESLACAELLASQQY